MNKLLRFCSLLLCFCSLMACAPSTEKSPNVTPLPTYTGPEYMHGTVRSLASIYGQQDLEVSGFGLVVNLEGTGSSEVPPQIREKLITEMTRRGFGSEKYNTRNLTPAAVLQDMDTAVVMVKGYIPAGAPVGTRFDLEVEALPESSTTSLAGGTLYTMEMTRNGKMIGQPQGFTFAEGYGPIFVNPFLDERSKTGDIHDARRSGRIVGGGAVVRERTLELVLNRASYRMSSNVAERIQTRIGSDKAATPLDDQRIALRIPQSLQYDPHRYLMLVGHMFLNPSPQFIESKSDELASMLRDPSHADQVDAIAFIWEAMGRPVLASIREYYTSDVPALRQAAMQAGARLGDMQTAERLHLLALAGKGTECEIATALLGDLLANHPRDYSLADKVAKLLDHRDPLVRVAAFEALRRIQDPLVSSQRLVFDSKLEVFQIDYVSQRPMVYVTQSGVPRIIIFGRVGLNPGGLLSLWDGQLMLENRGGANDIAVFFKDPAEQRPQTGSIPPTVVHLIGTLAFKPGPLSRTLGFDFSYNRVLEVLYQLSETGAINAPIVMQTETQVERRQRRLLSQPSLIRPNTEPSSTDLGPSATR